MTVTQAVKDIIWMARRYANGRKTGAPDMFNDAYDALRSEFGDDIDPKNAIDMQGVKYHDITIEHTKEHPYAKGDFDSFNVSRRKYYGA